MKSGNFVVKSHSPLRHKGVVGAIAFSAVLAVWGSYELGQYRAGYNRIEASNAQGNLEEQIESLEAKNSELKAEVTMLKRTQEVDRVAFEDVRLSLKQHQEEMLELREEREFYRGIVSPSDTMTGLNIQNFNLEKAGERGLYHFSLVMTQVLKNDRQVTGKVKFVLHGVKDGEPSELDFKDISPNKNFVNDFRFRYFQKIEGDIRLPKGFVARDVVVNIDPKGRKEVSKSFPWADAN